MAAVTAHAQEPPRIAAAPPAVKNKVTQLIDDVLESEVELEVALRRSKIIRLKRDAVRVAVGDPAIIDFVAFGPRELEVIGKQTGTTTITLWLGDDLPNANAEPNQILSILVRVTRDKAVADRRKLEYHELQTMLNELFPYSKLQLFPVANKLIVRGQARDEEEVAKILSIIRQNGQSQSGGAQGGGAADTAADPFPDEGQRLPESSIVSMIRVPGEKQVMLKVRIAEVKRSAARRFGVTFNVDLDNFFLASALAGGGNILASGTFDNASFNLVLNALTTNGYAKILAEPNLVVISGQPATFLSGGQFAVPTVVGVGGAQAATTSFKGYGTQLAFTPVVLDKDRIRLEVMPTFSTLNRENSVQGIFGLDARSVSTTVEMREGQVLAIAGLLQEQQAGELSAVPLLGSIPLLKHAFSNRSTSRDETELIVLVSPELVHPLEPEDAPAILPGMEITDPDDIDFFLHGHIEGRPDCHHRSTVWRLYRDRLKRCGLPINTHSAENYYLQGPHGFSE